MSNDPYADFEAMVRRTEKLMENSQTEAEELRRAVESVTVIGSNKDSSVRVKINHLGNLEDIKFTDAAMRLGPDGLRTAINNGIAAAQRQLSDKIARAAEGVLGEDAEMSAWITGDYVRQYGQPEPAVVKAERER